MMSTHDNNCTHWINKPCNCLATPRTEDKDTVPLHPLHSPEFVSKFVTTQGCLPGLRHTGRSTAYALTYVAQALRKPFEPVLLVDHFDSTTAHTMMRDAVNEIISKLDFRSFVIAKAAGRPGVWTLTFGVK